MNGSEIYAELVDLKRDFAAICLRDAATFLEKFDLQNAHLKILVARQQMESLVTLMNGDRKARKPRKPRTPPVNNNGGKCPQCGETFKGLRGVEVHIARKHKPKEA